MQRFRTIRRASTALALAALGVTMSAHGASAAPSPAAGDLPPTPVVDVSVTDRHVTVAGPTTLRPGLRTFRLNPLGDEREIVLVHLHPGYSLARFRSDEAAAEGQGDPVALARVRANRDLIGNVDSQPGRVETFTVGLAPGTYYLYSAAYGVVDPHRLVVAGPLLVTRPPLPTAVIQEHDNSFDAPTVLPTVGRILISDQGRYSHLACLYGVRQGTTRGQVLSYLRNPGDAGPSFATGVLGCSGDLDPQGALEWGYFRPAGTYLLFDPTPDPRANGASYAEAGALRFVTVR